MSKRKQIKQLTQVEKRRLIESRLKISPEMSNRSIAKMLGVSPTTVGTVRRELGDEIVQTGQVDTVDYNWVNHPYLIANPKLLSGLSEKSLRAIRAEGVLDLMMQRNSTSPRYCQRLLYEERKQANKHPDVIIKEDDIKIFQGDITTGLPAIEDNSVDLVFVDPPYDKRAVIGLYRHIAEVSERILVDNASLLVMTGGAHLDIALKELSAANKTLKFNWNISYICKRGTPLIQSRKVATAVKNIVWFVKNEYNGSIIYDLIEAPPDPDNKDKEHHIWGQSIQAVQYLIEKFTSEGDTVCDFMCGGGSTAVASVLSNRKFIGCDIDPEAVKTTQKRVRQLFGGK